MVKIVVSVPVAGAQKVRDAMADSGAGKTGNYSDCSFSYKGIGRFKPLEGAHPFIGEIGKLEEVEEERIEMICERGVTKDVIAAMKKAHPYEKPAYDIIELVFEEEL